MINDIEIFSGLGGVAKNGVFAGRNLGTISSLNEYLAFRSAHGIDDKSYKDLYLGDYFQIVDGTYNETWMVAHFDYYWNKGNHSTTNSSRGVVLIPRIKCGESKMNDEENTTVGAYKASSANTTTCPAIANALSTVLGSYLLNPFKLISKEIDANAYSMAGAGWTGCSSAWEWVQNRCILPGEVQIYGCTILSSSLYDIGEACEKLAIFNFINQTEYDRQFFWLRNVANKARFCRADGNGDAHFADPSNLVSLRPLIYIG